MLLVILRFNIQPKSTQQALHWHVSTPPSSSPSFLVLLVNTVVPLLAKQENKQPCGRVHMFTLGVLSTTAQTTNKITTTGVTGTQDPTVIPMAKGKKKARNMDPALRTWLRGHVTRKRIRNTKWAPRGLAVDLGPTSVHDMDEESVSFYFWTISQYGSTALDWNVLFDMSCFGGEDQKIFACWWREHGRTAWLIPALVPILVRIRFLFLFSTKHFTPSRESS